MKQERDIEKYTQDYLAESNDFEKQMVIIRRKKVLEILESYQPKLILEIGCGDDSIANYYHNSEQFTIVEPSKTFSQKAQNDCQDSKKVQVINDFIEHQTLSLKNQRFDFIILSSLLHEVQNPKTLLKDVFSLCSTKTILHINVPNAHSFHLLWAYESGLIKLGSLTKTAQKLQQNTTFTLESLENMLNEVNGGGCINIMDKGSYFIKPFNHSKMQECVKQKIIDEKLLLGLEKMVQYMPNLGAEIFINCKVVK